ncbi:DNA primase/helicase [Gordonia phage Orla]|nr:DNA primase/helicase [Gordonia phage Orla]
MTSREQQQFRILKRIWSSVKEGYVFMPWIPKDAARTTNRREHWHEDRAFAWPADKDAILEHLAAHADDDLYFAPMVFSEKERRSEYAMSGSRLWADLDEVDPRSIDDDLRPAVAWETSPGRYAAVWTLNSARSNTAGPGRENHRLTMHLEADSSGWDATQLLRVPLSANNKPGYEEGIRGTIVWTGGPTHTWEAFDALPEVKVAHVESNIDEQLLEGIDRHEVWARVRKRVNRNVRQYMVMQDTGGLDRSEVIWQIERELADAGCSLGEIVEVVRHTVWNKFGGRQDELKRLMMEASKAISLRGDDGEVFTTPDEDKKPDSLTPFWEQDDYLDVPEPEWLVPQMIPTGGCGFIAGIPKSMKSWLALDLAISLTTGEPWLESVPTSTPNVLYIQEEDPPVLVRDRHNTIASSKDPKWALSTVRAEVRPYPAKLYMQILQGFDGTDDAWQTWLGDMIREHSIGMVIFDTLATIAPGVDIDSGREVKGDLLDPIKQIARATGAAMLIVHHMTKAGSNERAGQNMAGSGQIHAWADFGVYVTNKEERTGTATLTFNHETKYTGTNTYKFTVDGLDNKVWNPVMQRTEEPTDAEREPDARGHHAAHMRECVPVISDVDPLSPDVNKSLKLRRAYLKWAIEQGHTIKQAAEDMGVQVSAAQRTFQYLVNDYPHLAQ